MAYADTSKANIMSSKENRAFSGINRRASDMLQRYGWSAYNRVMGAARNMMNGMLEKGLANAKG